jgi:hypothetical protein
MNATFYQGLSQFADNERSQDARHLDPVHHTHRGIRLRELVMMLGLWLCGIRGSVEASRESSFP